MGDAYVVTHIAKTCDENGVYVTKDSSEVIEIAWIIVNAKTLEEVSWGLVQSVFFSNGLDCTRFNIGSAL